MQAGLRGRGDYQPTSPGFTSRAGLLGEHNLQWNMGLSWQVLQAEAGQGRRSHLERLAAAVTPLQSLTPALSWRGGCSQAISRQTNCEPAQGTDTYLLKKQADNPTAMVAWRPNALHLKKPGCGLQGRSIHIPLCSTTFLRQNCEHPYVPVAPARLPQCNYSLSPLDLSEIRVISF